MVLCTVPLHKEPHHVHKETHHNMRRGVRHAMTARPERVPAEEVRQRMLNAGRALAEEAGAALTIEHLRLEEVIQRARVPRSSVYRLWAYREDYTEDLLCYLA